MTSQSQRAPLHIAHATRILQPAATTAKVSSIHINGWFGEHNRRVGARWIVTDLEGASSGAHPHVLKSQHPTSPNPILKTASTLSFCELGCSKGGRSLFQGLDCTLDSGQWLYVVGANGAGKTSLLRMVCGLAPVDEGQILWNGTPIQDQRDAYHQDLCYLGHLNSLQESMSVHENLSFATALGGHALPKDAANDVLARFGMAGRGHQLVRHLSQGQKRRVALSRLALSPARLWVLDEPFVAMDDTGVCLLADLIAAHLAQGGLAVLTSHQRVDIGDISPQMLALRA